MISSDLIERLRARAAHRISRSDALDTTSESSHLGGVFKTVRWRLGEPAAGPTDLPAPATSDEIATVEAMLGFALPDDLKHLYTAIANGGFGPADGLAPLEEVAKRYLDLRTAPPGEQGQRWPDHLLPINLTEPGLDCYDLQSGEIVFWDEKSLAEGPSDRVWHRSFERAAENLSAWLEDWLARPPKREALDHEMDQVLRDGLRSTMAHWRAMAPEERAAMGLPDEGWEEELFGHLGVDLKTL